MTSIRISTVLVLLSWASQLRASEDRYSEIDLGFGAPSIFVHCPGGEFLMGPNLHSYAEMRDGSSLVKLSPFKILRTEVNQLSWRRVMGIYFEKHLLLEGLRFEKSAIGHDLPVFGVSYYDAILYCENLTELARERGLITDDLEFRLPTEAEWEYAWFSKGRAQGHVEPDGWHLMNSEGNTHPVRSRTSSSSKPLHDMLGNVAEWCWDWKGPVVAFSHSVDPRGPEKGIHRVIRGGSWAEHPMCARGGYRGDFSPVLPRSAFVGFRPVRTVIGQGS